MKKIIILLIVISNYAWAADFGLISTTGYAEKSIEPNMVVVQIESFGKAGNAKMAQEKQAVEYQRIKSTVEKFKIKKDDIQTENMNLNQEYSYDQKTQSNKVVGYRVSHSLKVILRKKEDIGQFLDAVSSSAKTDSSGVQIQGISWDNDNKINQTNSLINDAVSDAKKKAEALAQAAGVKIRGIHQINYGTSNVNYTLPTGGGPMMEMAMMKSSAPTEVSTGSIKLRTEVHIQFRID